MAIDPICGMAVDEATARSAEKDGQTFYFCGDHCRQKFLASAPSNTKQPVAHAAHAPHGHHAPSSPSPPPSSQKPQQSAAKYTCPMHPDVQSDQPGNCPKCGMALELARPAARQQKVIYTCPMHPQIEQDRPG